jgi:hypothetical protein
MMKATYIAKNVEQLMAVSLDSHVISLTLFIAMTATT